ncbi:MAG: hypothetical protein WBL80_04260, partial [Erysipelotrichaceae bacterium]
MKTENGKSGSNLKSSNKIFQILKSFLKSGEARIEDAGFLLDLLESGCSREEVETAIGHTLHDEKTVARFIQKRRMALFRQTETRFGFGFSLLLCLQLRVRSAHETGSLLRTLAYPMVLIVSGYCVSAMYLFVIAVTIEANRTLFQMGTMIPLQTLQSLFIVFSVFILILSIRVIYRLATRPQRIFAKLSATLPNNPWSIALSRRMAFHIAKLHALGLSTRDICLTISDYPKEPILAGIAVSMYDELGAGNTLQTSLASLDPFLIRILRIESHPDFAARLNGYDAIARKRYEYSVKKLGYFASIGAYLFISVLIFVLYK